jgi:CheY-like chemotaxis protein
MRRPESTPRSSIASVAATILIVEDEHAVARGIQYALQQEGYDVGVARSGEEGLEIATREAPDLVVLDVRLPGIDGFEVLRRVRAAQRRVPRCRSSCSPPATTRSIRSSDSSSAPTTT